MTKLTESEFEIVLKDLTSKIIESDKKSEKLFQQVFLRLEALEKRNNQFDNYKKEVDQNVEKGQEFIIILLISKFLSLQQNNCRPKNILNCQAQVAPFKNRVEQKQNKAYYRNACNRFA
jgi:hypothetical protein